MASVLFSKNLGVPHYTPTIYTSVFLGIIQKVTEFEEMNRKQGAKEQNFYSWDIHTE